MVSHSDFRLFTSPVFVTVLKRQMEETVAIIYS